MRTDRGQNNHYNVNHELFLQIVHLISHVVKHPFLLTENKKQTAVINILNLHIF